MRITPNGVECNFELPLDGDQAGHQNTMCLQQIRFTFWLPGVETVIDHPRVFDLLNLAGKGDHSFSSRMGFICASLRVLPSMASEPFFLGPANID